MSSDGILRLDLDLEDATMPNGTHKATVDGTETPKEAKKVLMPPSNAREVADKHVEPSAEEEAQTESEVSPQKKVIKPPMPPIKEAKTPEEEPEKDNSSEKKVCIILYMPYHKRQEYLFMSFCLDNMAYKI